MYARRDNGPILETLSERMLSISVIKSVDHLTFEVRDQVDQKKRDTHRAKIALRERISAEFLIGMQGVKTTQSGNF